MPLALGRQPEAIQQNWFSPTLANGAFMHSLLCASALHRYMTVPGGTNQDVLHHRAAAIAAVNENISIPELALSDANLAAVFNLLCVEETMFLPTFASKNGGLFED